MVELLRKVTRITNSGKFIPEIDGLRFFAIFWVVMFHLNGFVIKKVNIEPIRTDNILHWLLSNGEQGVELFFIISGFVVALPFIKNAAAKSDFSIKSYYYRRLWRLVPPCMVVTIALFFIHVFIVKKYTPDELLTSFFASSLYISNFIFTDRLPLINPVTWSLEVEMQFYLIAPFFLNYVFSKKTIRSRFVIYAGVFFISVIAKHTLQFHFISLLGYIHYFIAGIALCDLYKNNIKLNFITPKNDKIYFIISLLLILLIKVKYNPVFDVIYPIIVLIFCYTILICKCSLSKFLRYDLFVIIGGMCYSIYLIHYTVISIAGNFIVRHAVVKDYMLNLCINGLIILPVILGISVCYYIFFERPFMKFPNRFLKYVK